MNYLSNMGWAAGLILAAVVAIPVMWIVGSVLRDMGGKNDDQD